MKLKGGLVARTNEGHPMLDPKKDYVGEWKRRQGMTNAEKLKERRKIMDAYRPGRDVHRDTGWDVGFRPANRQQKGSGWMKTREYNITDPKSGVNAQIEAPPRRLFDNDKFNPKKKEKKLRKKGRRHSPGMWHETGPTKKNKNRREVDLYSPGVGMGDMAPKAKLAQDRGGMRILNKLAGHMKHTKAQGRPTTYNASVINDTLAHKLGRFRDRNPQFKKQIKVRNRKRMARRAAYNDELQNQNSQWEW
jgi:hypothetical protein